ncbi:MAG TPA: PHB depolymerase family esterase, partial [Puia sp.]|nr:PHB depolymerase family esterase [Puia sp.]
MRKIYLLFASLFLFFTAAVNPVHAQQTPEEFVQKTGYLLYLPDGYAADTSKQWPLVLFLHGSGESGADLEKVKVHGPPKLVAQGRKFPFILVSPQCPSAMVGWNSETLYALLLDIKQKYRVDADRVYLTGLSMGGYGTWALAMKHPEVLAAIAPLCGGGDTSDIWKLRHMPVWCFHGALDNVVPIRGEELLTSTLKRYNPDVRFTVYPDAGHDCWT